MPRRFHFSRAGAVALALAAVPSAWAASPVFIASTVPYLNDEVGNPEVRSECDWNSKLPQFIVETSEGRAVIDDAGFAAPGGRKLSIVIVNVHAIGGASFTGPKWAVLHGKLTDNDDVVGTFEIGRNTIKGSFRACRTLRNLAEELADDVGEWLQHPTIDPAVKE